MIALPGVTWGWYETVADMVDQYTQQEAVETVLVYVGANIRDDWRLW